MRLNQPLGFYRYHLTQTLLGSVTTPIEIGYKINITTTRGHCMHLSGKGDFRVDSRNYARQAQRVARRRPVLSRGKCSLKGRDIGIWLRKVDINVFPR